MTRAGDLRSTFRSLHTKPSATPTPGILVMPNAWDPGAAKLLAAVGVEALATTSSGHAGTLGRLDQSVQRDEVLDHVVGMSAATDLPLSVDSEDCFAESAEGVKETATMLAATDAAGFSIEDFDPRTSRIRAIADAVERVAAAREGGADLVLTARAENLLHGVTDLDDTIARLIAYRDAGADVVYAPGLSHADDIERVVTAVEIPVNVLARPGSPPIPHLAELGVARVSTGGSLTWHAYGALIEAAHEILGPGTHEYVTRNLSPELRDAAFHA